MGKIMPWSSEEIAEMKREAANFRYEFEGNPKIECASMAVGADRTLKWCKTVEKLAEERDETIEIANGLTEDLATMRETAMDMRNLFINLLDRHDYEFINDIKAISKMIEQTKWLDSQGEEMESEGGEDTECCDNCSFRKKGRCHRHPPTGNSSLSAPLPFPRWCGEWKKQQSLSDLTKRLLAI